MLQVVDGKLTGVEIFRAGDYGKKGVYSTADVANIAKLRTGHEPPLTKDHDKRGEAYGWTKKVYAKGDTLLADFENIPPEAASAINARRYKKFSIELYPSDKTLKAVTLLGAQIPEVKGLNPTFKEDEEQPITFDEYPSLPWSCYDVPKYLPPSDPFPNTHQAITQEILSDVIAGHQHWIYMDEKGNGFTSPMIVQNPVTRLYSIDDNSHVHQVTKWAVQESATPFPHTHSYGKYETYSESNQEDAHMADQKDQKPNPAPTPEQLKFSEQENELKSLREAQAASVAAQAASNKLIADLVRSNKQARAEAEFSELTKSNTDGVIPPAAVKLAKDLFIFHATEETTIKFGEGAEAETPFARLKKFIAAIPRVKTGVEIKDDHNLSFSENGNEDKGVKIAKRAKVIQVERKIEDFSDALRFAEEEYANGGIK